MLEGDVIGRVMRDNMPMVYVIRYWLHALRLRTLPLAASTVMLGSVLAYRDQLYTVTTCVWMLLTMSSLQLLSNLSNDLGDSVHGIDHAGRKGPARMAQRGYLSAVALKRSLAIFGIISLLLGVGLLWHVFGPMSAYFWLFLIVGLFALWAAVRYAYGTRPYGHRGWGDLFVWIFFGPIGAIATYFLHTHAWNAAIVLPSAGLGACAVAVLNINNLRDIESDLIAGKRTLAGRLGAKSAVRYHRFLLLGSLLCWVTYGYWQLHYSWGWLFVLAYTMLPVLWTGVRAHTEGHVLTKRLRQMVVLTLCQIVYFTIGLCLD